MKATILVCSFATSALLLGGCATTNRTKTLLLMGGVGAVTGGVGYTAAPQGERPEMHAAYWGAAGAAIAGAIGLFLFDEQKRSDELERQVGVARLALDALRHEGGSSDPQLLYETSTPFGREIPPEYQGLVRPGRWSVYKLNQWVSQGEGVLIHQDRMLKIVPPQLTPNQKTTLSGGVGLSESGEEASIPLPNGSDKQQAAGEEKS